MRTMMNIKWDGVTPDQYDQVRRIVNWENDRPQGGLFHVAGYTNNAMRITDIWESEEDFNNFVQNRLMPGVQQLGLSSPSQVEAISVHALFIPSTQELLSVPSHY